MKAEEKDYKDAHVKLDVKCKDKHKFLISFNNLKGNKWCPVCSAFRMELFTKSTVETIFQKPFEKIKPKWLEGLELDMYNQELN